MSFSNRKPLSSTSSSSNSKNKTQSSTASKLKTSTLQTAKTSSSSSSASQATGHQKSSAVNENEILFAKIKLLQIDFLQNQKIIPTFNHKMARLERECLQKTRVFKEIMDKLEAYKEIQDREEALDELQKQVASFYNNPSIPSLESLEMLRKEYESFMTILSNRKNMMQISGSIYANASQIQSAINRLIPTLEKELANQIYPNANSPAERIKQLNEKREELESQLEQYEAEEREKDQAWILKKKELDAEIQRLSSTYLEMKNEIDDKISDLSPLI